MDESKRQYRRLDGPVNRAAKSQSGPAKGPAPLDLRAKTGSPAPTPAAPKLVPITQEPSEYIGQSNELHEVDLGDVDNNALNQPEALPPGPRPEAKPKWWKRANRKHAAVTMATVIVTVVGFIGFKAVIASSNVVTANSGDGAPALNGEVDPTKLKGEGDGRINILLLGVGGKGHDGGTLSDTIMVASIDPAGKTVAMLSIPRDLYVKIPGRHNAKINAASGYGGPELTKTVVGNMLDLPIHYYVQLDFAGFRQAVDAVGGVDVNNPTALADRQYPCDSGRGFCPFTMPAGPQHLDGKLALKYARCRHGSCGADFGRAARQQLLLLALRQKALDASTLTNPVKVAGLIDSVGNHVRTDFQPEEWKKMALIIKDIDPAKSTNKVLDNSPDGLLKDGTGQFSGVGSILIPRTGAFDYTEIQEMAHSLFVDGYLKQENAALQVQNGTGRDGLASSLAKQLKAYSYNVIGAATAPEPATASRIIDYTGGKKPYTVKYLKSRFNAQVEQAPPPATTGSQPAPEIVILVGSDYKPTSLR